MYTTAGDKNIDKNFNKKKKNAIILYVHKINGGLSSAIASRLVDIWCCCLACYRQVAPIIGRMIVQARPAQSS